MQRTQGWREAGTSAEQSWQRSGWLEYREQREGVWGDIRERQMKQGSVGHIRESGLYSKSSGKPLKDLSRGIT